MQLSQRGSAFVCEYHVSTPGLYVLDVMLEEHAIDEQTSPRAGLYAAADAVQSAHTSAPAAPSRRGSGVRRRPHLRGFPRVIAIVSPAALSFHRTGAFAPGSKLHNGFYAVHFGTPEQATEFYTVQGRIADAHDIWAVYRGLPPLDALQNHGGVGASVGAGANCSRFAGAVWLDKRDVKLRAIVKQAQAHVAGLVNASSLVRVQVAAMLVSNATGGAIDRDDDGTIQPWADHNNNVSETAMSLGAACRCLRQHQALSLARHDTFGPTDPRQRFEVIVSRIRGLVFKWVCDSCDIRCGLVQQANGVTVATVLLARGGARATPGEYTVDLLCAPHAVTARAPTHLETQTSSGAGGQGESRGLFGGKRSSSSKGGGLFGSPKSGVPQTASRRRAGGRVGLTIPQ